MINTNSIVKFSSVEALNKAYTNNKITKNTTNLDDYYGIVRDSYKTGYYVEFFNKTSKALDIAFYEEVDLTPCGGLYDLIKNSVVGSQTKAKIQSAKKKISKETNILEKTSKVDESRELQKELNAPKETLDIDALSKEQLKGKRVLSTGKFFMIKDIDRFKELLQQNGMLYTPSVTKNLDILVECSKANSSRIRKARENGAIIISEYKFYKILKNE